MELYLREFNKKFSFKASNKNMRATVKMQLNLAKAEDIEDKEPKEQLSSFLNMTDSVEGYVKDILKLSDKEYEKLENMDFNTTVELANKIASKVLGIDEDAVKKAQAKEKK